MSNPSTPGTSKQSDNCYASQGTPPSSPAAGTIFSRVMGAATGNKQAQGNPLGLAAVLLQGAQAGNGIGSRGSNSSSSGSSSSTNSQAVPLQSSPASTAAFVSVNSVTRRQSSSATGL